MPPTSPTLFFSHSSKDTAHIRELVTNLKAQGISVWFDGDDIRPGDAISRKMSEGLRTSERLLVAWSNHAASSDHVWNEIDAFYIRCPKPGFILFLRLDETPIPTLYAARTFLDANGDANNLAETIKAWVMGGESIRLEVRDADSPPADDLHMFPRGPMVPLHLITNALVQAYADSASTQVRATAVIHNSVRLRIEADPGDPRVTTISLSDLPSLNHTGAFEFWQIALFEACKNGPRMLAALLFSQPDDLFQPSARSDRAKLFQYLRGLTQQAV